MIVCSCQRVRSEQILQLLEKGISDPCAISTLSGAGTNCGGCMPNLEKLLKAGRCVNVEMQQPALKKVGAS